MARSEQVDVIVVGAGAAGCVVAARLATQGSRSVLLLEAGPDVRSTPALDLLDGWRLPQIADWGYTASDGQKRRSWSRVRTKGASVNDPFSSTSVRVSSIAAERDGTRTARLAEPRHKTEIVRRKSGRSATRNNRVRRSVITEAAGEAGAAPASRPRLGRPASARRPRPTTRSRHGSGPPTARRLDG